MLKVSPEPIHIDEFLIQMMEDLNSPLTLYGDIPKAIVSTDPKRLEQVMENIVNNAQKYAKTEIFLSASKEIDYYNVMVKDLGSGIPDESFPFIMDKFYRGTNAKDESGSGLGLYIVKYIMEQTGGKVTPSQKISPGFSKAINQNRKILSLYG